MSQKHLAAGSELPPRDKDKWRLFSMEYCPYAHRVRLVLDVKKVEYDIVNCNLINKPEWLFTLHPEGKVPALDTGSTVVVESLDICEFIENAQPQPPLYSTDETVKEAQKALIAKMSDLTNVFTTIVLEKERKTPAQWMEELRPHLDVFEEGFTSDDGVYFGGAEPCMVDYMLWPWAERAGAIPLVLGDALPVGTDEYPKLRAWRKAMRARTEIGNIYHGPDKFVQVVYFKTRGAYPDYDNIK